MVFSMFSGNCVFPISFADVGMMMMQSGMVKTEHFHPEGNKDVECAKPNFILCAWSFILPFLAFLFLPFCLVLSYSIVAPAQYLP